jgi:branched-chain amino acid transport system substrate-binding protein
MTRDNFGEDKGMCQRHPWWSGLVAAVLVGLAGVTAGAAAGAQFLPVLSVREGGLRDSQTMIDGFIAYLTLLNERDGGIHGVPLVWEECETVYDVARGVECYERLKGQGPTGAAAFVSIGTPIAYALTERATQDQIPLLTPGIGRSDTADGRVFPYVFPAPTNWWSQNTAKIRFIGQRVGGMEQLKGLKIVHVHIDNATGWETIPILDTQAA